MLLRIATQLFRAVLLWWKNHHIDEWCMRRKVNRQAKNGSTNKQSISLIPTYSNMTEHAPRGLFEDSNFKDIPPFCKIRPQRTNSTKLDSASADKWGPKLAL